MVKDDTRLGYLDDQEISKGTQSYVYAHSNRPPNSDRSIMLPQSSHLFIFLTMSNGPIP